MKILKLLMLGLLLLAPLADAADENPASPASVEERRIRSAIEEQYNRIQKDGDQLKVDQMELKTLQLEVDKKLGQMQGLRDELTKLLGRKQAEEGKRVIELSKIYEKMSSIKAADLIKNLDPQLAIELLGTMNKKNAGKILDNLDQKTATKLSTGFAEIPVDQTPGF